MVLHNKTLITQIKILIIAKRDISINQELGDKIRQKKMEISKIVMLIPVKQTSLIDYKAYKVPSK